MLCCGRSECAGGRLRTLGPLGSAWGLGVSWLSQSIPPKDEMTLGTKVGFAYRKDQNGLLTLSLQCLRKPLGSAYVYPWRLLFPTRKSPKLIPAR